MGQHRILNAFEKNKLRVNALVNLFPSCSSSPQTKENEKKKVYGKFLLSQNKKHSNQYVFWKIIFKNIQTFMQHWHTNSCRMKCFVGVESFVTLSPVLYVELEWKIIIIKIIKKCCKKK